MAQKKSGDEVIANHRKAVVEKIVQDMKTEGLHWMNPYLSTFTPHNPVTGTIYRGGNRLHLGYAAYSKGFSDTRWLTFNQVVANGWKVKKGEHGSPIEKWKAFATEKENEETGETEIDKVFLRLVGHFTVFNGEQIEGIPPEKEPERAEDEYSIQIANTMILSSRCPVIEDHHHNESPCYVPSKDCILTKPRNEYVGDTRFLMTLLHEMVHSTGHESALNRNICNRFGSSDYAFEELIAQMGSLFLCADLHVHELTFENDFYQNHVAYLQSWIQRLENDPDFLFKAASKADKAGEFIMARYDKCLDKDLEKEVIVPKKERMGLSELAQNARAASAALAGEDKSTGLEETR